MTTLDSGVIALDRYTGEEVWHTSTADHEEGGIPRRGLR